MAARAAKGISAQIKCVKKIIFDTEPHIRHGTSLMLRIVIWYVTKESVSESLLGSPVLEALGLNTADILAAAAERYNGSLDLSHLCNDSEIGRIAWVYDGFCHVDHGDDWNESEKVDQWPDLGEDKDEDWEAALQVALNNASKNRISDEGIPELEHLIREYKDVIRLRLYRQEPVKVKPMKINLKIYTVLVRARQQKYSPEKRELIEKCVDDLLTLGFVVPAKEPEQVTAPNIVSKKTAGHVLYGIGSLPD